MASFTRLSSLAQLLIALARCVSSTSTILAQHSDMETKWISEGSSVQQRSERAAPQGNFRSRTFIILARIGRVPSRCKTFSQSEQTKLDLEPPARHIPPIDSECSPVLPDGRLIDSLVPE